MKKVITVVASLVFVAICIVLLGGCGNNSAWIPLSDSEIKEMERVAAQEPTIEQLQARYKRSEGKEQFTLERLTKNGWEKVVDVGAIDYYPNYFSYSAHGNSSNGYVAFADIDDIVDYSGNLRLVLNWTLGNKIIEQKIIGAETERQAIVWKQDRYDYSTSTTKYYSWCKIGEIEVVLYATPKSRINISYLVGDSKWTFAPEGLYLDEKEKKDIAITFVPLLDEYNKAGYVEDGKFSINVPSGTYIVQTCLPDGLTRKDEVNVKIGSQVDLKISVPPEVFSQK